MSKQTLCPLIKRKKTSYLQKIKQNNWKKDLGELSPTICLRGLTLFSDDLPTSCFEEKSIKTMLPGVAFFNLINGIFRVFYKKFDLIILKIWSLLLFSQSVRELMGDWKERSVNRPRREWIPSDKSLILIFSCKISSSIKFKFLKSKGLLHCLYPIN